MILTNENIKIENIESKFALLRVNNDSFGKYRFDSKAYQISYFGWQFKRNVSIEITFLKKQENDFEVTYSIHNSWILLFIGAISINILIDILIFLFRNHYHVAHKLFEQFKLIHPFFLFSFTAICIFQVYAMCFDAKRDLLKNISE